mmetsp:Transcript_3488/g.14068  ORF Transcript_3488/g.14068 Transcript_3488/m.14068 type:complete len:232 (+) Transcript_3488:148-843(+)
MRKEKRSWYSRTYDHAASAAKAQPRRKKSAGASKPATLFVRVHAPNDSRVVTRHAALVGRHLENRTENANGRNSSAKSSAASAARRAGDAKTSKIEDSKTDRGASSDVRKAGRLVAACATRNAHTSSCFLAGLKFENGTNDTRLVPTRNASAKSVGTSFAGEYTPRVYADETSSVVDASAGSANEKTTKTRSAKKHSRRSESCSRASSHCVSTSASAKVSKPTFCVFQGVC